MVEVAVMAMPTGLVFVQAIEGAMAAEIGVEARVAEVTMMTILMPKLLNCD